MEGVVVRRVIPSDNSCLFNAVGYVMEHNKNKASELRKVIAAAVASDPEKYNEAFLGKPNEAYCARILDPEKWGGAIELSILSEYYGREIAAYDIQTTRCDLYGQGKNYNERAMLIYDGLRYDALSVSFCDSNPLLNMYMYMLSFCDDLYMYDDPRDAAQSDDPRDATQSDGPRDATQSDPRDATQSDGPRDAAQRGAAAASNKKPVKEPKKGKKRDDPMVEVMAQYMEIKRKQAEEESALLAGSKNAQEFSISKCIAVLHKMESIPRGQRAAAYKVFKNAENREIFLNSAAEDEESAAVFLRSEMAELPRGI